MVILLGGKNWEAETKGSYFFIYLFKSKGKGRSFIIPIVIVYLLFLNEDLVS